MSTFESGSQPRQRDGGLTDTVQEGAAHMKEKGGEQVRNQLDQRTSQVGQQARTFADTLRRTGGEMESQGGNGAATKVANGVADRIERVGGYLEGARGDDLLHDAERFARQRPWMVAGAAAAVGFAASRLLKASSERRYDDSYRGMESEARWREGSQRGAGYGGMDTTRMDGEHVGSRATVVTPGA